MAKKLARRNEPRPGALLTQARGMLLHFNLKARKGLAQHFLVDEEVLRRIVAAAGLSPADVVMEVGPGLGVLTRELAQQAGWVVAVELDDKLMTMLKETLAAFNNVTIVNADILDVDPGALLAEQGSKLPPALSTSRYKVVANLPYYITSPVLRHFLEATVKPEMMLIMVQKEVAESIVAKPGEMSILSISVQFYGKPSIISYVPAQSFYPAPQVDSAIVRIDLYPQPAVAVETGGFFELVRAGFTAARKQLGNSLAQGLGQPKPEVLALLAEAHIEPKRRAETLTLDEWARLWQALSRVRGEKHADTAGAG